MSSRRLTLPCPLCGTDDALTCKVVVTGEGFWVTRLSQTCACKVYEAWEEVWWQAKYRMNAQERKTG